MKFDQIRRDYLEGGLRRSDLKEDPIEQFQDWLQQTIDAGFSDPTAMTVATVAADGQPSQRVVLLKFLDQRGFVFYTNLASRKARELKANSRISLHFPWHQIGRQVKVCGVAELLGVKDNLAYFLSRPRESQLAAWASTQSRAIPSRQMLMQQFSSMKQKFSAGEVPLPDFWGGYRVTPHEIEFWQGGEHRLHDRFRYTLAEPGGWKIERLAP